MGKELIDDLRVQLRRAWDNYIEIRLVATAFPDRRPTAIALAISKSEVERLEYALAEAEIAAGYLHGGGPR